MNLLTHLHKNSSLVSRVPIHNIILVSLLADARIVAKEHLVASKTVSEVLDSFKPFGDCQMVAGWLEELARRDEIRFMDELIVLGEVIEGENVLFCNKHKVIDCSEQFEKLKLLYKNYHTFAKKNGRGSIAYQCGRRLSYLMDKPLMSFENCDVRNLYASVYEVIFQTVHPPFTGKECGIMNNLVKSLMPDKAVEMVFQYFYNHESYGSNVGVGLFNYHKAKILKDLEGNPENNGVQIRNGRERI